MTILSSDLKLVKTQVMLDTPDGGGAPTGVVVVDGASNQVFPDISDVDRAIGRVNMRKLALHVDSPNTDQYLGSNVLIANPPDDENVSITLMAGTYFDRRAEAVSRLAAYLSIGVQEPRVLFGNHIAGQSTILVYQKTEDTPGIGDTLVLTKREGFGDQHLQYIRVIEILSNVKTTFEDDRGTYERYVVTMRLLSPLDADYAGFDVQRYDYTGSQFALRTKISNTVVADAARYYGVVPLAEPASIGDFSVKASSIFTQLVPSAQIETPIPDARTNQVSAGVIASGGSVVMTTTAVFSTVQNFFIGGPFAPNSLSITNAGVTVTDQGGRLMSGGSQVGVCDYENGILQLTVSVFGTAALPLSIVYTPAAVPASVNQTQGFEITAANRATNYVRTIEPAPVRGTLSVSYMAQGRWYVLREQGDGSIRGSDAAYGAGSLNFTTGTLVVSLGALPDVGSFLIIQWVEPAAARASDSLTLDNNGKLYWSFNTAGVSSIEAGPKSIKPGALVITWLDGVTTRTVNDNGAGILTGAATGTVDYAKGVIRMSPTVLPAPGTAINVSVDSANTIPVTATVASGSGNFGVTGITPGSISMTVDAQLKYVYGGNSIKDWGAPRSFNVTDDGVGGLQIHLLDTLVAFGTVNYSAGTFTLLSSILIAPSTAAVLTAWDNIYLADDNGLNMFYEVAHA